MTSKATPTTQTTNSATQVAPWLQSAEQGILGNAMGIQNPGAYTGQGVAPMTANQLQALTTASGNVGTAQQILQPAEGTATTLQGWLPSQLTASGINADTLGLLNPYTNTAVNQTNQLINQEGQLQNNQSDAKAAMDGAFGSDRNAVQTALNNQVTQQTLANTDASMLNNQFNTAQNTATGIANSNQAASIAGAGLNLNAAGVNGSLASILSGLNSNDINGLLGTGSVAQTTGQNQDTFNLQQFLAPYQQQLQDLQLQGGIAGGFAPGNTSTNSTTTGQVFSSPLAGIAGLGLGLAGLGTGGGATLGGTAISSIASALPLMLSDRRMKTDVKSVGRLNNGFTIYSFRYKHDPSRTQIGLMAQDVEKTRPDAVVGILGTKFVDYAKAAA
jgi:Chaperone of endosialidase